MTVDPLNHLVTFLASIVAGWIGAKATLRATREAIGHDLQQGREQREHEATQEQVRRRTDAYASLVAALRSAESYIAIPWVSHVDALAGIDVALARVELVGSLRVWTHGADARDAMRALASAVRAFGSDMMGNRADFARLAAAFREAFPEGSDDPPAEHRVGCAADRAIRARQEVVALMCGEVGASRLPAQGEA